MDILFNHKILSNVDILINIFEYFLIRTYKKPKLFEFVRYDCKRVKYILYKSRKLRNAFNKHNMGANYDIKNIPPCLLSPNFFILNIGALTAEKYAPEIKAKYPSLKLKLQIGKCLRPIDNINVFDYIDFSYKYYPDNWFNNDIIKVNYITTGNYIKAGTINPILKLSYTRNAIITEPFHKVFISHCVNIKFVNDKCIEHVIIKNCKNIEFKNVKNYQSAFRMHSWNIKIQSVQNVILCRTKNFHAKFCNKLDIQDCENVRIDKCNYVIEYKTNNSVINDHDGLMHVPYYQIISYYSNYTLNNNHIIKTFDMGGMCYLGVQPHNGIRSTVIINNCKNLEKVILVNSEVIINNCPKLKTIINRCSNVSCPQNIEQINTDENVFKSIPMFTVKSEKKL